MPLSNKYKSAVPIAPEPIKDSWEWDPKGRIVESFKESIGTLLGAGSAVSQALGYERGRDWLAEKAANQFEEAAEMGIDHTIFKEIDDPLDAGKWALEVLTGYVPDFGMMILGGAGLGTAAARTVSKKGLEKTVRGFLKGSYKRNLNQLRKANVGKDVANKSEFLAKAAAKNTARDLGALLGAASVEGFQSGGQNFLEQLEERGDNANPWASMGVGLGVTAIGMLSPVTRGVAGAVTGKLPSRVNLGTIALGEFAEESGQEAWTMLIESGLDPNQTFGEVVSSEEGLWRLFESGMAGLVLGTAFGAGAKGISRAFGKKEETDPVKREVEEVLDPEKRNSTLEREGISTAEDTQDPPDLPPVPPGSDPGVTVEEDPLDQIMLPVYEDGKDTGEQVPASYLLEKQDNNIEKWYYIKECLAS